MKRASKEGHHHEVMKTHQRKNHKGEEIKAEWKFKEAKQKDLVTLDKMALQFWKLLRGLLRCDRARSVRMFSANSCILL